MDIAVIGTDHTLADISEREKIAKLFFKRFSSSFLPVDSDFSCVLVQTCNRSELYFSAKNLKKAQREIEAILYQEAPELFEKSLYSFSHFACFCHLVEVTTGLKSAVFGETAIQGQIRRCYEEARKFPLSKELHFLFQKSLKIGKNIRTESYFLEASTNIEQPIYQKTKEFLKKRHNAPILFVGASSINTSIARYFAAKGITNTFVCNRSTHKTAHFSQVLPWDALKDACQKAHVIIAATTCPQILVSEDAFNDSSHKLLIDLAMPRNIAPELSSRHALLNIDAFSQKKPPHRHTYAYTKAKHTVREAIQRQIAIFSAKTCPQGVFYEKKAI